VHKQELPCIIKKLMARIFSLALNSERAVQIMHPGRPVVLFGAASVVAILSGSYLLHAYQAASPKPIPEDFERTELRDPVPGLSHTCQRAALKGARPWRKLAVMERHCHAPRAMAKA
jgi:hypothetical protein